MGLGCGPPKEWSSDVFPAETPRTLLSSPVYFLLPTVIESSGKHWGKGGISEEVIPVLLLLLFKLFPELNIKASTLLKLRRQVKRKPQDQTESLNSLQKPNNAEQKYSLITATIAR